MKPPPRLRRLEHRGKNPVSDGSQLPAATTQQTPMWIMHQVFTRRRAADGGEARAQDVITEKHLYRSSSQHVEQLQTRHVDTVDLSECISL